MDLFILIFWVSNLAFHNNSVNSPHGPSAQLLQWYLWVTKCYAGKLIYIHVYHIWIHYFQWPIWIFNFSISIATHSINRKNSKKNLKTKQMETKWKSRFFMSITVFILLYFQLYWCSLFRGLCCPESGKSMTFHKVIAYMHREPRPSLVQIMACCW